MTAETTRELIDRPRRGQQPKDVIEAKKILLQLRKEFNFKKNIQDLEELVLADSGKDEFNEIFKLIFAKIWDESEAQENRKSKVVEFRKALDPDITFDRINALFHKAAAKERRSKKFLDQAKTRVEQPIEEVVRQ